MKQGFWSADWLVALVVCVVFALAAWAGNPLLNALERSAYEAGVRSSDKPPSDRIAVVAIDDQSIANIGRWPWPRSVISEMIGTLHAGGAKVIGIPIAFSEPETSPGLSYIERIDELHRAAGEPVAPITQLIGSARSELDTDARLAQSIAAAGNVVLGMEFVIQEPVGNPDAPLPSYVTRNFIPENSPKVVAGEDALDYGLLPWPASRAVTPPIASLGEASAGIGHMNVILDEYGNRTEPLVLRYYDSYVPSFALQVAASSLNLGPEDIGLTLGESVQLGRLRIGTSPYLEMLTFFYAERGGKAPFPVDSFFDVREGKIPAGKYRDKVVLIGPTATGVGTPQKTPVDPAMAPVTSLAHAVSSILQEHFFVVPGWASWAELAALLLVALYLVALLPRLKAGPAAAITVGLFVLLLGVEFVLMTTQSTWLRMVTPATLLVLGHAVLTTKRFLVTERGKEKSEAESAETNRMLGLAYQGKGELDMAFASFRKVRPVDESVLDLLYNLALDFERRRQFNKAVSVYQYVTQHAPDFRDVKARMNRSRNLEETVLLGSGGGSTAGGTLLLDGGDVQKPMLGRYQVEKELGKGAMGVVYLGKDPKINRTVAIKTMALSQEFEADELDEVKERFFREAETAGRLNHPNIVTIFDAGEEHDLAYIAMEFLRGKDLAGFTKQGTLLPVPKVLDIIIKSAEALDYAHGQNVVHRDIKPANIMYEPDSGNVKLTDFGIARITDSSKTKTGMVLGTPSYMSPEQLQGKKVDGRSDLFSLGVMMYQLLTGKLPFTGDSMTTLMWNISREPHTDILEVRPDLPPCMKAIIDKALHKSANERYARGAQMVEDVRACAARVAA